MAHRQAIGLPPTANGENLDAQGTAHGEKLAAQACLLQSCSFAELGAFVGAVM